MPEVVDALERHVRYLERSGELRLRRLERLRERVRETVEEQIRRRLWHDKDTEAWLERQLPAMEEGRMPPFVVADALRARSAELLTGTGDTPTTRTA
jgi:putative protein kinase ArgK-like GTPase of G3E family